LGTLARQPDELTPEEKRFFREQLRDARAQVLRDAEGFESIVRVVERLGRFLKPDGKGLASFFDPLSEIASRSALSVELPTCFPEYHLSFRALFESVRHGRNSAVHEGAAARHLTIHALELAFVLEDALMPATSTISEFMVRGPVIAAPWQPVSFVRHALLGNSFSYLPVMLQRDNSRRWQLISDVAVAAFLRGTDKATERNQRLQTRVEDAVRSGALRLDTPLCVKSDYRVTDLLGQLTSIPALVVGDSPDELIGIVTAFDLL